MLNRNGPFAQGFSKLHGKTPTRAVIAAIALTAGGVFNIAPATAAEPAALIQIQRGVNTVKLLGKGLPAIVVMGWRDNGNAHGFDVVTLYVKTDLAPNYPPRTWQIVPIFEPELIKGNGERESDMLTVNGGADCLLQDFRLIAPTESRPAQLILAERAFGDSFFDYQPVTFNTYVLATKDPNMSFGRPRYYFKWASSQVSTQKYCNVKVAFARELHLGDYRVPADQSWAWPK